MARASTGQTAQASSENVSAHLMMHAAAALFCGLPAEGRATASGFLRAKSAGAGASFRTWCDRREAHEPPLGVLQMPPACKATAERNDSAQSAPVLASVVPAHASCRSHTEHRRSLIAPSGPTLQAGVMLLSSESHCSAGGRRWGHGLGSAALSRARRPNAGLFVAPRRNVSPIGMNRSRALRCEVVRRAPAPGAHT
jgi:hypothetical protein